jgi:hypothetical protein
MNKRVRIHCLLQRSTLILILIWSGDVMNSLALTYCELKRPEDALPLQEQLLEVLQRTLPADHPRIGDALVSIWIAITSSPFFC